MPPASSRRRASRLARAAAAERMALLRERERLGRRRQQLARQLAAVDGELAAVEERLHLIDRLVPEAANVHPLPRRAPARDGLRGAAIRRAAVAVLRDRADATAPIHYRAWFELLEAAGHAVAGKDPLAVFLTQISRSPVVRRAAEPGVYALDVAAPARLRARLEALHGRLAALATRHDAAARAERDRIVAEIAVAERALDEAVDALGDLADDHGRARAARAHGAADRAARS